VNKGVLCGKGSAGIMTQYSPARLQAPLKRIGPRGSGEYAEISWDEAMDIATNALKKVRETDPKRLAFFTGRDQSAIADGVFGRAIRHAQFRGAWRLLFRQYGGRRALHHWRFLLGSLASPIGNAQNIC
jgi:anaerobic selenocysteine-containing dehydrogenase